MRRAASSKTASLAALPGWVDAVSQLNRLIAERMGVTASDLSCLHALDTAGSGHRGRAGSPRRPDAGVGVADDRPAGAGKLHQADR